MGVFWIGFICFVAGGIVGTGFMAIFAAKSKDDRIGEETGGGNNGEIAEH